MRKMGERNIIFLLFLFLFHFISFLFLIYSIIFQQTNVFLIVFFFQIIVATAITKTTMLFVRITKKQTYQVYNTFFLSHLSLSLSQLHDKLILLD